MCRPWRKTLLQRDVAARMDISLSQLQQEATKAAQTANVSKIPVDAIIERWKAKGCQKGQSRRLKKLFADGHVVDAEMEQAAGEFVTVTNVQCA